MSFLLSRHLLNTQPQLRMGLPNSSHQKAMDICRCHSRMKSSSVKPMIEWAKLMTCSTVGIDLAIC